MKHAMDGAYQRQFADRVQAVVNRMDAFHRQLRAIELDIDRVEKLADEVRLDRVRFAARDAYTRIAQAGVFLVDAHLQLSRMVETRTAPDAGEQNHE